MLRIFPHFMLIFLSTCGLCSRSLCTSTLPVFFYHQTPCENFTYLFVWKHERIYMEEFWKSEGFVWNMWRVFQENEKHIWKNAEFDWTSKRIYMVQRYSKYRFFDVNSILTYSKYRFSSAIPGMPGEAKISIPYSVWVEDLIYIYICIYTCCNVLGCSKCGGLRSWLITL